MSPTVAQLFGQYRFRCVLVVTVAGRADRGGTTEVCKEFVDGHGPAVRLAHDTATPVGNPFGRCGRRRSRDFGEPGQQDVLVSTVVDVAVNECRSTSRIERGGSLDVAAGSARERDRAEVSVTNLRQIAMSVSKAMGSTVKPALMGSSPGSRRWRSADAPVDREFRCGSYRRCALEQGSRGTSARVFRTVRTGVAVGVVGTRTRPGLVTVGRLRA